MIHMLLLKRGGWDKRKHNFHKRKEDTINENQEKMI